MVRPGRESFKRFIKTIIEQLSPHIEMYPPADQNLLMDFLSVLQHYEEADYNRNKLSQRFEEYNKKVLGTDQYLQTAFLWFTFNYFWNAIPLLNISKFHGDLLYEYLVKHLRGSPTTPGVYGLVRGNIPLSDLAWEQLQYESNKLLIPLTENQLRIINSVYSCIEETGVYALDPHKLRSMIVKRVDFPKNIKPSDELNRFFIRMEGRWSFRFFSPALGLDRLIFNVQLQESTSLEDIIDFQNPENTVLCVSDIYSARNLPNTYFGNLLVPTQDIEQLESHLQQRENQGELILNKLLRITTTRTSVSLNHYQANSGWFRLSPTKMRRLTSLLKSKHPKKRQMKSYSLFLSSSFNDHWFYDQHPLSIEIIKLYSRIPDDFTYPYLPLRSNAQDSTALTRAEIGLLKQLICNKVVYIEFVPWRVVYEFSLDIYCILLPKIPLFQLKRFLLLIPYSEIHYTENNICILARLTPKLVRWIENDLNWTVISIIRIHQRQNLDFNWFDLVKLQWKTPNVLKTPREVHSKKRKKGRRNILQID